MGMWTFLVCLHFGHWLQQNEKIQRKAAMMSADTEWLL